MATLTSVGFKVNQKLQFWVENRGSMTALVSSTIDILHEIKKNGLCRAPGHAN